MRKVELLPTWTMRLATALEIDSHIPGCYEKITAIDTVIVKLKHCLLCT